MKDFDLTINDKSIPVTAIVYQTEDGYLYMGADFGENKDIWKSTFFPDIPEKELYREYKTLDQIYKQLEEKLIEYTQNKYDIKADWDIISYNSLLLIDGKFEMFTILDQ